MQQDLYLLFVPWALVVPPVYRLAAAQVRRLWSRAMLDADGVKADAPVQGCSRLLQGTSDESQMRLLEGTSEESQPIATSMQAPSTGTADPHMHMHMHTEEPSTGTADPTRLSPSNADSEAVSLGSRGPAWRVVGLTLLFAVLQLHSAPLGDNVFPLGAMPGFCWSQYHGSKTPRWVEPREFVWLESVQLLNSSAVGKSNSELSPAIRPCYTQKRANFAMQPDLPAALTRGKLNNWWLHHSMKVAQASWGYIFTNCSGWASLAKLALRAPHNILRGPPGTVAPLWLGSNTSRNYVTVRFRLLKLGLSSSMSLDRQMRLAAVAASTPQLVMDVHLVRRPGGDWSVKQAAAIAPAAQPPRQGHAMNSSTGPVSPLSRTASSQAARHRSAGMSSRDQLTHTHTGTHGPTQRPAPPGRRLADPHNASKMRNSQKPPPNSASLKHAACYSNHRGELHARAEA